jgi:hypothetical protein
MPEANVSGLIHSRKSTYLPPPLGDETTLVAAKLFAMAPKTHPNSPPIEPIIKDSRRKHVKTWNRL